MSIKQFYAGHIFHSMARLDVPTFEDPVVQRQLESVGATPWGSSIAWETIQLTTGIVMTFIRLLSQLSVLFAVLREQQEGPLLAVLSFSQSIFNWYSTRRELLSHSNGRSTANVASVYLSQTCSLGCNHK